MGTCVHFSRSLPSNSWWQSGDFQDADSNPKCNTATSRIRIVLDRRHEGGARHLAEWRCREHVASPTAPALDRAAIDANDQSESSSPEPVTSQSAPRSQRGRRGVQDSAAAAASRGFRLLKIRSGATTYGLINHAALSSPEISGPTRSQTQIRFGGEHP
jgi:hypothetical protein